MLKGNTKTKKIMAIAFGAMLTVGMLTGCGTSTKEKNPTTKEVIENIKNSTEFADMQEGNEEKLEKFVGVKSEDIEEISFYIPKTNLQADEVAVIKVKDEAKVEDMKKQIEAKVNENGEGFKDYLPEQYNLVENKVLKSERTYILLAVSKDAEKIEEAFDGSLK